MSKRKIAKGAAPTPAQLDKLIEEAIVDCYDEEEQASGFFTRSRTISPCRSLLGSSVSRCLWSPSKWMMMVASKPCASTAANSNASA
jgi:hypothetical protein